MMFIRRNNFQPKRITTINLINKSQFIRYFSESNEPDFMVKSDITEDPKNVYIPILREETRKEIYKLYKSDPKLWTVTHKLKKTLELLLINLRFLNRQVKFLKNTKCLLIELKQ